MLTTDLFEGGGSLSKNKGYDDLVSTVTKAFAGIKPEISGDKAKYTVIFKWNNQGKAALKSQKYQEEIDKDGEPTGNIIGAPMLAVTSADNTEITYKLNL